MARIEQEGWSSSARALDWASAEPIRRRSKVWLWTAVGIASLPFLTGLSTTRVFYIRDLSLYFWGRYLWLRRTVLAGEWPFWDPYVGAGQAAAPDALHQMFLLPVLLLRLVGNEVLSFNLWVALPFPLAAWGTWLFLSSRFSPSGAALGAVAFALSGPIVSTGNFPNMSWSVAAMPWILWCADRLSVALTPRRAAGLALASAFQALAGEPVTFSATAVLAVALCTLDGDESRSAAPLWRRAGWTVASVGLGVCLAAIQLVPMVAAASVAERSGATSGFWSLHPLALVETVAFRFFGDYFSIQSLSDAPWMPLLNTGREPFFFSLYFGLPLFVLALYGLVANGRSRWGIFWAAAGGASLLLAFGMYTPVYPFLREYVPFMASFRFPVKYLVVFSMAVSAGAASGWDALGGRASGGASTVARARLDAVIVALLIALSAAALALAAGHTPDWVATKAASTARALGAITVEPAVEFVLSAMPRLWITVVWMALAAAALLLLATSHSKRASLARYALYAVVVGDLVLRAWSLNPVFDVAHLAEPEWLTRSKVDSDARFYVGGKREGTLDPWDVDGSRAFLNPPGLSGSASRAALSGQAVFYPSAWHGREMLSYDLPVLWPKLFQDVTERFFEVDRKGRDLFLDRTGVRFRILPDRFYPGRMALMPIPYFAESSLYDWGTGTAPRVSIVTSARTVPDPTSQAALLFEEGWDFRETVLLSEEPPAAGSANGDAVPVSSAALASETTTRVVVDARVPASGGYLVMLDSYSDDWHATVDGEPAQVVRANGLFRAVRLLPGQHTVEFRYRPRTLLLGTVISTIAVLMLIALLVLGDRWNRFFSRPAASVGATG